jgi:hypothetical protein
MRGSPLIRFHISYLERALKERASSKSMSLQARDCLERYFMLVEEELRGVSFSAAEANLLADAAKRISSAQQIRFLWAIVQEEACHNPHQRQVDVDALVAKLHSACPGQIFAIVDALERAEVLGGGPEALRAVGLIANT